MVIDKLIKQLLEKLDQAYSKENKNEMIFVLKAIANTNRLDDASSPKIVNIIKNKSLPNRLRVAALETALVNSCQHSIKHSVLSLLQDIQEDSELRIKAYLVCVKCPSYETAAAVKTLLENEPSYQVGGFIASHLYYLRLSTDPDKKKAASYFTDIKPSREYPVDPRKYSLFSQFDYDIWGMPNNVEASVIYSQDSFLPRSTNLDLTAEVFGHKLSFLSVETRQQNLERVLEHYFGPLGVFNKINKYDILNHFNTNNKKQVKRDANQAIHNSTRYGLIGASDINNELGIDLNIKLFGSELFFISLTDDVENLSLNNIINKFYDNQQSTIKELERFDEDYRTNTVFLDSQFSYPTSSGFPLRVDVEGVASVQVKSEGTLDFTTLMYESPQKNLFKLSLIPSGSIEIAGSITLDTQLYESGIKVVSTLHTATGGRLEMNLHDLNKNIEMKFSLPLKNQKILSVSYGAVVSFREPGKLAIAKPITSSQNRDIHMCLESVSSLTGINVCMDTSIPMANSGQLPLFGENYKFSLVANNQDFSHLLLKQQGFTDLKKSGYQLEVDVVRTNQEKKTSVVIEAFSRPETYIRIGVFTPISEAFIKTRLINNEQEQLALFEYKQDNLQYFAKVGMMVSATAAQLRYTPILQCTISDTQRRKWSPVTVHGSIVVDKSDPGSVTFNFEDLKLHIENSKLQPSIYSINGNMGQSGHDYFTDITTSDGAANIHLKGKLYFQKNTIKLDGHLKNSKDPNTNVYVNYIFQRLPTKISSSLQIVHGEDPNSQHNRVTISNQLISRPLDNYNYDVATKNKISYPAGDFLFIADYTSRGKNIHYDLQVKYGSLAMGSNFNLKYDQKTYGDYDLSFRVYNSDDDVRLKAELDIQGDTYNINNVLIVNDEKYALHGSLKATQTKDIDFVADLIVKIPQVENPFTVYENLKYYTDYSKLNNVFKIGKGHEEYVSSKLTAGEDGIHGNLKVEVENLFVFNVFANDTGESATVEFVINVKETLMKSEIKYIYINPYSIYFSFYPDFKQSSTDYIKITSINDVHKNSWDSKNTFDFSGSKTLINGRWNEESHLHNEIRSWGADIKTSIGNFWSIQYDYKHNETAGGLNLEQSVILQAPPLTGAPNAKTVSIIAEEIVRNLNEDNFDYTYLITLDDGNGNNLHFDLYAKKEDSRSSKLISEEYKVFVYAAQPVEGFEMMISHVYNDFDGRYNYLIKGTEGRYLLDISGKYNMNSLYGTKPVTEEITIEIKTPSRKIRHLKIDGNFESDNSSMTMYDCKAFVNMEYNDAQLLKYESTVNIKTDNELVTSELKCNVDWKGTNPIAFSANVLDHKHTMVPKEKITFNLDIVRERENIYKYESVIERNNYKVESNTVIQSDKFPTITMKIYSKISEVLDQQMYHAMVTQNNEVYEYIQELDLRSTSPGFKIQYIYPGREINQIILKANISEDIDVKAQLLVQLHNYDFLFVSTLDASIKSDEDFLVNLKVHSPKIDVYNFIANVENHPVSNPHRSTRSNDSERSSWYRPVRHADNPYGYSNQRYNPRHEDRNSLAMVSSYDAVTTKERLRFSLQHAGRNVISGSASYIKQHEENAVILKGTGTYVFEEDPPKQHAYKITKITSFNSKDGGFEVAYTWNLTIDKSLVTANLKLTENGGEFSNQVFDSGNCIVNTNAHFYSFYISESNYETSEGFFTEYGRLYKTQIDIKNKIVNKNNVFDAHGQAYIADQYKYEYKIYNTDEIIEASITTLKRIISLEGRAKTLGQDGGPTNFDINLFLNKKQQPHQKTSLSGIVDCRNEDVKCNIEVKFSDPLLPRDISAISMLTVDPSSMDLKHDMVLDIFSDPEDKLIYTSHYNVHKIDILGGRSILLKFDIVSKGLGIDLTYDELYYLDPRAPRYHWIIDYKLGNADYKNNVTINLTPQEAAIVLKLYNEEILNINSMFNVKDYSATPHTDVHALGIHPFSIDMEILSNSFKSTISQLDNPNDRLEVVLTVFATNSIDFGVKYFEQGSSIDLIKYSATITDQNKIVKHHLYDKENIQRMLIRPIEKKYRHFEEEFGHIENQHHKVMYLEIEKTEDLVKRHTLDFSPLIQKYERELNELFYELIDAPIISETFKFVYFITIVTTDKIEKLQPYINEIIDIIEQQKMKIEQDILDIYETSLEPLVMASLYISGNLYVRMATVAERLLDDINHLMSQVVQILDKAVSYVSKFVLETLEDVLIWSANLVHNLKIALTKILGRFETEYKAIKVFQELESKLQEAREGKPISEDYIRNFKEAVETMKTWTEYSSVKDFFSKFSYYTEQKLRHQRLDSFSVFQDIFQAGLEVLHEVYGVAPPSKDSIDRIVEALYSISRLFKIGFPEVEWTKLPLLLELMSLDIDEYTAIIAQGHHIFTFDGNYLMLQGDCSYKFAQDVVNNNFSIFGTYKNKEFASISFSDKFDTVTIRKGGQILMNNALSEYPLERENRLKVYRNHESITIWSDSGVRIICGPELLVCGIHVSGYYHAQLGGLLGNSNHEPYDDYKLPSGLIITDEATFENSYKLNSYCVDVRNAPKIHPYPSCRRLFNKYSLRECRDIVDPKPYIKACDLGTAVRTPHTDLAITTAYVASCRSRNVPIDVPPRFVKCENYKKSTHINDQFKITVPQKAADIVFIVDQDNNNEAIFVNLLQSLTKKLTNSLNTAGISDVKFYLIGYGGQHTQPVNYSVDGKLAFTANRIPHMQFSVPTKNDFGERLKEYVEVFVEKVNVFTDINMLLKAYITATKIPWRAQAVRSIIALNGKPCNNSHLNVIQDLINWFISGTQISLHLFTPFVEVNQRNRISSNIVGFDDSRFYSFSKPDGSKSKLQLKYDDVCVDYVLKNNGNVFVTNNFPKRESQYVQIATKNIVDKLTYTEQQLECTCTMVSPYSAQNQCEVSNTHKIY